MKYTHNVVYFGFYCIELQLFVYYLEFFKISNWSKKNPSQASYFELKPNTQTWLVWKLQPSLIKVCFVLEYIHKPLGLKSKYEIINAFFSIIDAKDVSVGFVTCSSYIGQFVLNKNLICTIEWSFGCLGFTINGV